MALRAALLGLSLSLALPEQCAKLLGQQGPPPTQPEPPPPTVPVTSATTPPIWVPPDPNGGVQPIPTAAPPPNPDLAKAKGFAAAGEHKKVRTLLEKKLKAGQVSTEEAQVLAASCAALKDKKCLDLVKAKHPEVDTTAQ